MFTWKKQIKAFTLIETLLASVIAAIVLVTITSYFLNMVYGKQQFLVRQELEYNLQFAVDQIRTTIRKATGVNEAASVFDSHPGSITLLTSSDPIVIASTGQNLTSTTGSNDPVSLITSRIQVSNFTLSFDQPNNSPGIVNCQLTLQSTVDDSVSKSESFSVSLRINSN